MPAAIEILALIMRTETILTRPVEFEIASRLVIKIRDNTKDMRVTLLVQKIGLERLRALCKLPEKGDASLVHPAIEQVHIRTAIDGTEGNGLVQIRYPAFVKHTGWTRRTK
ncbi:hypothetical protein D3C80_1946680 [compost metagenome]